MNIKSMNYPEVKGFDLRNLINPYGCTDDLHDEFFNWFLEIKDSRESLMMDLIGIKNHEKIGMADFVPISKLVEGNIYVRIRSLREMEKEWDFSKLDDSEVFSYWKKSRKELVEPTLSMVFDFSICLGNYFIRKFPKSFWRVDEDYKSATYLKPLVSFPTLTITPFSVIYGVTRNIIENPLDYNAYLRQIEFLEKKILRNYQK